eukprot:gene38332-47324_t
MASEVDAAKNISHSLFLKAAQDGHAERLRELLSHTEVDVNCRFSGEEGNKENGFTALHFAASNGHYSSAILILTAGGDVNALSQVGIDVLTPIYYAVRNSHLSCVALLLASGAAISDFKDEHHKSLLDWAMENDDHAIEVILMAHSAANKIRED